MLLISKILLSIKMARNGDNKMTKLIYTVVAGKFDDNEENIKFVDDADSLEDAKKMIEEKNLYTYPICRIEVTGFKS